MLRFVMNEKYNVTSHRNLENITHFKMIITGLFIISNNTDDLLSFHKSTNELVTHGSQIKKVVEFESHHLCLQKHEIPQKYLKCV